MIKNNFGYKIKNSPSSRVSFFNQLWKEFLNSRLSWGNNFYKSCQSTDVYCHLVLNQLLGWFFNDFTAKPKLMATKKAAKRKGIPGK